METSTKELMEQRVLLPAGMVTMTIWGKGSKKLWALEKENE